MRISEAILLGSTMIKPIGGRVMNDDGTKGCALGMAMIAVGNNQWNEYYGSFPVLGWEVEMPACCNATMGRLCRDRLSALITHVFDCHVMGRGAKWTLEQLVDCVRDREDKLEQEDRAAVLPPITEVPEATEACVTV